MNSNYEVMRQILPSCFELSDPPIDPVLIIPPPTDDNEQAE